VPAANVNGRHSRPYEEGIAPTGVTLREPSLDDVFLALTGQPPADEPAAGSPPPSPVRGAV